MKSIVCILTIFVLLNTAVYSENISCKELEEHLKNGEAVESMLMVNKFNRSGSTVIDKNDGNLWEMWIKLQRLKKEKKALFKEKGCQEKLANQ